MSTNDRIVEQVFNRVDLLLEQYHERGVLRKEIRSYEVSLWTLQDEFITVLKWSDAEHIGRIEKPIMTLNVDGTQTFECTIPMYIRYNGELIENPNWHLKNEFTILNLRKMKVIFNKWTDNEAVYEFVITGCTEDHERDILTCNVKCEGLAFHEIGKRGYKLSLSDDTYLNVLNDWKEDHNGESEPLETIDFWCGHRTTLHLPYATNYPNPNPDPTIWYYKVLMNWNSFANGGQRDTNKIYEEPYASNWNDQLQPTAIQEFREKERPISAENSNVYNITQTIAETFGVYCRYEYGHDENYHINSRTIVFYNNFMQEDNVVSFTYPHTSQKVSRTMESNELTTKLYVLDTDNESNIYGYNSITNAVANPTMEDYILNFDYLYKTRGITEEQYQAIKQFEIDIRAYNKNMIPLENEIQKYENKRPELDGKKTFYKNSMDAAQQQIDATNDLLTALDAKDGTVDGACTKDNPDTAFIHKREDETKYINLSTTNKGIIADTVKIYTTYGVVNHTLSNQIAATKFYFEYDEYNHPIRIVGFGDQQEGTKVYLTYDYVPEDYYASVLKIWCDKKKSDEYNYEYYSTQVEYVDTLLENLHNAIEDLSEQKKECISKFEHMMGPALREGYWQPSDYKDYGNQMNNTHNLVNNNDFYDSDEGTDFSVGWDSILFEDEQDISYNASINPNDIQYYPCINLNTVFSNNIPANIDEYSVVFYPQVTAQANINKIQYIQTFKVGGEALLRFVKKGSSITPVLLLIGAKTMSDDVIANMMGTSEGQAGVPKLGIFNTSVSGTTINFTITNSHALTDCWLTLDNTYKVVYPRIKFTSYDLEPDTLVVYYKNELLQNYYDYQVLSRINDNSGVLETIVNIKPEVLFKKQSSNAAVKVFYTLSNANVQIYLDALRISKENAWPKVSYEVTPTLLNLDLSRTLYNRLAQLVMINDPELKFEDTFGYISGMTLDLDAPQNDTIEVKNYKTKFEDLFSNIVAQTESMKANEGRISALLEGNIPVSVEGLTQVLEGNGTYNLIQAYLDSHFDTSEVVEQRLKSLFDEAGDILGQSQSSLNQMMALSTQNAAILSGFADRVSKELTVKVEKGPNRPTSFKPGDVWLKTEVVNGVETVVARYVATYSSDDIKNNSTGTSGYVQTYDGTLASITGAGMEIDANTGLVDIYGEHEIKLRSGEHIYIAADDVVDIVGNREVNIGGTTINIASSSTSADDVGGINLVATKYDTANIENAAVSKVLIHPDEIYMAGSKITMLTGTTSGSVSAIELDGSKGIKVASNKTISLFAANNNGNTANVEINPSHILFGMNNLTSNSAAITEITEKYMIFAVGTSRASLDGDNENIAIDSAVSGVKITKERIGLATGSGTNRSIITLGEDGIKLGSGTTALTSGSYINISGKKLELGSLADLYINANNFKLQTNVSASGEGTTLLAIGTNLNSVSYQTAYTDGSFKNGNANLSVTPTVQLLVNQNGLYVKGTIHADAGYFIGDVTATSFTLSDPNFTITSNRISDIQTTITNNTTVQTALSTAQTAASNIEPFTHDGLSYGLTWGGTNYGVVLSNSSTAKPMLIGSNSGITIAKSATSGDGAAVAIDKSGIALTGATISLNASSKINIASGGDLYLNAGGVLINTEATSGNVFSISKTGGGSLTFDTSGNLSITGNITATSGSFTGTVTSTNFTASAGANGNKFMATSSAFGLYDSSNNPILTFSTANNKSYMNIAQDYIIQAAGGLTISTGKDFILNTNTCKIISNAATNEEMLYMADTNSWSTATTGMRFVVGQGLEIKGTISGGKIISDGTEITIGQVVTLPATVSQLRTDVDALGDLDLSEVITMDYFSNWIINDYQPLLDDVAWSSDISNLQRQINDLQRLIAGYHGGQQIDPNDDSSGEIDINYDQEDTSGDGKDP